MIMQKNHRTPAKQKKARFSRDTHERTKPQANRKKI